MAKKIFKNVTNKIKSSYNDFNAKSLANKSLKADIKFKKQMQNQQINKQKLQNQKLKTKINNEKIRGSKSQIKRDQQFEKDMAVMRQDAKNVKSYYDHLNTKVKNQWKTDLVRGVTGVAVTDDIFNNNNESEITDAIKKAIG